MKIYGGLREVSIQNALLLEQKKLVQRYHSKFFTYKMGHNSLMMK